MADDKILRLENSMDPSIKPGGSHAPCARAKGLVPVSTLIGEYLNFFSHGCETLDELDSVIQMSGFRSLGDEEEVEFECKNSDKGLESTLVTGLGGADCCGSHRRPTSKKRFRKIRCYNCGEFANHIAAKCTMGPQPKRCHNCKSQDHLIADCPTRLDRKKPSLITIVNELEHEDNGTGGNVDSTMPGQD
uniref:CCHC-type domain-containing protein n=1 Tax=Timema monikensis TaxID=170555 RepID=A0A7R9EAR2_9NEOP|nr:unnamed protein product [Timema monikensis]